MTSRADQALALDRQLCFMLYATSRAVTRAYRPLLEPHRLTYPQYLVLLVLWESGAAAPTLKEVGERLDLDSGTLTPLLKRLEQHGWITRGRDPDDEREVRISLTPRGRALRRTARRFPRDLLLRSGMDASGVEALRAQLAELHEQLRP